MMKLVAINHTPHKSYLRHWKLEVGCDLKITFDVGGRTVLLNNIPLPIPDEENIVICEYKERAEYKPIKWEN